MGHGEKRQRAMGQRGKGHGAWAKGLEHGARGIGMGQGARGI